MSYQPAPDNSGTLKAINWGVWILVFVFVGIPVLIGICCCLGPTILAAIGHMVDASNQ